MKKLTGQMKKVLIGVKERTKRVAKSQKGAGIITILVIVLGVVLVANAAPPVITWGGKFVDRSLAFVDSVVGTIIS